jgi:tryptophanyl-tRNA synthetase
MGVFCCLDLFRKGSAMIATSAPDVRTQPQPAAEATNKKRILSGIQPSGDLTLGNYLGAIRNWVRQQHECQSFHPIVNLHAMSVPYDPAVLRRRTLELAAGLFACGLDPETAVVFVQSEVPEHTELTWILCTQTMYGELGRMIQFKEKRGTASDAKVGAGLFFYPVLQAADILIYDADLVPVGEDQRQHIELTRDVGMRFNATFGETFKIPEADIKTDGARIMGLDDPSKKMSKSASTAANFIALSDEPDVIRRKINRAVTDSGSEIVAREDKPALTNLLTIFSLITDTPIPELESRYDGAGYGQFKRELGDALAEHLEPIQSRMNELTSDPAELQRILRRGTERAREVTVPKMVQVRDAVGISL